MRGPPQTGEGQAAMTGPSRRRSRLRCRTAAPAVHLVSLLPCQPLLSQMLGCFPPGIFSANADTCDIGGIGGSSASHSGRHPMRKIRPLAVIENGVLRREIRRIWAEPRIDISGLDRDDAAGV